MWVTTLVVFLFYCQPALAVGGPQAAAGIVLLCMAAGCLVAALSLFLGNISRHFYPRRDQALFRQTVIWGSSALILFVTGGVVFGTH